MSETVKLVPAQLFECLRLLVLVGFIAGVLAHMGYRTFAGRR
jgi:hypothetical protein